MEPDLVWSFTGHRPDKIGNDVAGLYPHAMAIRLWFRDLIKLWTPKEAYVGMAMGVDTWAAEECIRADIPYVASIPFEGFDKAWPAASRNHLQWLLLRAKEIVIVSTGTYRPYFYQQRNQFMVDNSQQLIAVWNGTKGGTWNCINYARRKQVPIEYFTNETLGYPSDPSNLTVPRRL